MRLFEKILFPGARRVWDFPGFLAHQFTLDIREKRKSESALCSRDNHIKTPFAVSILTGVKKVIQFVPESTNLVADISFPLFFFLYAQVSQSLTLVYEYIMYIRVLFFRFYFVVAFAVFKGRWSQPNAVASRNIALERYVLLL